MDQNFYPTQNQANSPAPISPPVNGLKNFYKQNKIYIWAIIVGLVIISGLAFFAFKKPAQVLPKEANVDVQIQAPETAASGSEAVFKIKVENRDTNTIISPVLEVVYPEGMSFLSSSPQAENLSGSSFSVPDLSTNQNAMVMIKAKVIGSVNDNIKLNVKLHYRLSNFNSEFIKPAENTLRLTASDISLDFTGPQQSSNAQPVMYEIKYKNNSTEDIRNARLQLSYPDGFSFALADPQPDLGNNIWTISLFPQGAEGKIDFQGVFKTAAAGESKSFLAEFQALDNQGGFYTQAQSAFVTALESQPLLVSQAIEGDDGGNVAPGSGLTFTIQYQNNGTIAATGVNILLTLDSSALDLSSLSADGGIVTGNTVLWNAASVPNLETLPPGDSGQLSLRVKVKNPATRDSSENLKITSSIKIKSNEFQSFFPGNEATLKVASPVSLGTNLTYLSGSKPPQVGKATVYKMAISLKNQTNAYSDGVITAFLPQGAGSFEPSSISPSESGKVQFDPSTGKLTWNFGQLVAHAGNFNPVKLLSFSVRITPAISQAGSSPVLVSDIKFQAKDTFTGRTVNLSGNNVDTSNLSGGMGYEDGRVVE